MRLKKRGLKMAKIIHKGLAKTNSKLILQSSLIAPIMVFPHLKKNKKK